MKKSSIILSFLLIFAACSQIKLVDVQETNPPAKQKSETVSTTVGQTIVEADPSLVTDDQDPALSQTNQETVDLNQYQADTALAVISWTGSKPGLSFNGTVPLVEGNLSLDDGITTGNGSFIIDMTGIDTENQQLEDHLKNEDFFEVLTYPQAKLNVTSLTASQDNTLEVTADLTIKDVTNQIAFPAQVKTENQNLIMEAGFSIDRTKWGIKYGSSTLLGEIGDSIIDDQIGFGVYLVFSKQLPVTSDQETQDSDQSNIIEEEVVDAGEQTSEETVDTSDTGDQDVTTNQ